MFANDTQVRIRKVQDLLSGGTAQKLGEVGVVAGVRIVDGSGFGYIVRFQDGTQRWYFADEVELVTST